MKYYKLPTLSTNADAVILANGDFPTHPIPLSILNNSNFLVCCDGAIDALAQTTILPNAIVGDCDSLSDSNKKKYANIICQISEQDTNDLTKSVNFCIEQGMKHIIILGATGKREDHTIANISLLADYIDLVDDICMITNYGIFNAIEQDSQFESKQHQQVSIFCIAPSEVTSHSLKYEIHKRTFTNWWQATLNEALTDNFVIESNNKLIVYRTF